MSSQNRPGVMEFRPGYILSLEFSAIGGVNYRRELVDEVIEGQELRAEFRTQKHVDNVDMQKTSRAIINQAYHIVDKHATPTPIGYWVDAEALEKIMTELAGPQEAARMFNELAASLGSRRRVEIHVYPLRLPEFQDDSFAAARRVARDVRERLQGMRDTLAVADRKGFELAYDKARNLDRMAVGVQADAIRMALDHARLTKTHMLEALRAGHDPEAVAKVLDLEPIDAAIQLFEEPADATSQVADELTNAA